ncbi:MAG: site-specific DNA-methyltransferase [Chloroflexi bacterium]|nr:site-specific DNA-methyltransferase [Chloroflexota bacterium]
MFGRYYETKHGIAYLGDAREVLAAGEWDGAVDLIMTSPPFALRRKKEYGNVEASRYTEWFLDFAKLFHRVLKPDGSLVIHIGGSWNHGTPTRSLYQYELLVDLCKQADFTFHLAQEFFVFNPARLPSPAEWVTVRRERVKDAVDCVWWLSKVAHPKADNRRVLRPYSESMEELLRRGYKPMLRPSGHDISPKFARRNEGAIPPNLLEIANTESNSRYLRACRQSGTKAHPARFPAALPEFFIKFLTVPGDLVLDPFAGSNVTGEVCEKLGRRWMAIDIAEEYLRGSKFRFDEFMLGDWADARGQPTFVLRDTPEYRGAPAEPSP